MLADVEDPNAWQDDALCSFLDGDLWFPELGGQSPPLAKELCSQCAVRRQCLEYAIEHDIRFGIWGGMAERERRKYSARIT